MQHHESLAHSYKNSGVDISAGDKASSTAFSYAKKSFSIRHQKQGEPFHIENGFSGALAFGDSYLTHNSDGIGSKVLVAQALRKFDTLGFDLVAMLADDAVCLGAEPMSLVNTIDTEKVSQTPVDEMMRGLLSASEVAGCCITGGEIAEMPELIKGFTWSGALTSAVKKEKLLGSFKVTKNDQLVALLTNNLRSNGFTLARKILEKKYGAQWHSTLFQDRTWGEFLLAPSQIFAPFILHLTGGLNSAPKSIVSACVHITGGGLIHNVNRVIPKHLKIKFTELPPPPKFMQELQNLGSVTLDEAYQVWNMGVGMVVITPEPEKVRSYANDFGIQTQLIGSLQERGIA